MIIRRKCSIGGNGSGGAIYGEMTIGSFQKIVDYMKKNLEFSEDSKFLDIGSGRGKPTLHVSQDPGVSLSMVFCYQFLKTKGISVLIQKILPSAGSSKVTLQSRKVYPHSPRSTLSILDGEKRNIKRLQSYSMNLQLACITFATKQ